MERGRRKVNPNVLGRADGDIRILDARAGLRRRVREICRFEREDINTNHDRPEMPSLHSMKLSLADTLERKWEEGGNG